MSLYIHQHFFPEHERILRADQLQCLLRGCSFHACALMHCLCRCTSSRRHLLLFINYLSVRRAASLYFSQPGHVTNRTQRNADAFCHKILSAFVGYV